MLKSIVEAAGGSDYIRYCFGEFDVVVILEMPDDTAIAVPSMAIGASGAVTNIRTTVLIPTANAFAVAQNARG